MPAAQLYPWEIWFARRRPVRLRRGRDYTCSTISMAQAVRNEASRRQVSVSVEETDNGLKVTVGESR